MKDLIHSAEYVLGLGLNSVADEVRDAYFSEIDNYDDYLYSVELIIKTILKNFDNKTISADEALNLITIEFEKSHIEDYISNYDNIITFVRKLIEIRSNTGKPNINYTKEFVEIAETLDEKMAIGIFSAALTNIVHKGMILEDIYFSQYLIEKIKSSTIPINERRMFDLTHDALFFG